MNSEQANVATQMFARLWSVPNVPKSIIDLATIGDWLDSRGFTSEESIIQQAHVYYPELEDYYKQYKLHPWAYYEEMLVAWATDEYISDKTKSQQERGVNAGGHQEYGGSPGPKIERNVDLRGQTDLSEVSRSGEDSKSSGGGWLVFFGVVAAVAVGAFAISRKPKRK